MPSLWPPACQLNWATSKGMYGPTTIAPTTSAENKIVARPIGIFRYLTHSPMTIVSTRYSSEAEAIAPPPTSPLAAVASPMNDAAVTSVNATMMYIRAIQMNARNSRYDQRLILSRTTSAIERALWRIEATSDEKSCTPPIRIEPTRIQISAGSQPNVSPARIGPTIGPAAAIAEKCCGTSDDGARGS